MGRETFFGGDRNVDCGGGYMSLRICEDSMNCILKTDAFMEFTPQSSQWKQRDNDLENKGLREPFRKMMATLSIE